MHPELSAAAVSAACWGLLLAPSAGGAARAAHADVHAAVPWLAGAAGWFAMCIAMMVPAALPHMRYLALTALWRRRQRTIAVFLASYLSVWMAFGFVAVVSVMWAERLLGVGAASLAGAVLAAAALWEFLPWKWRALRRCHLIGPLPPCGSKADLACAEAGLKYGRSCLVACWPMMLAMAIVGHEAVVLMAILSLVMAAEKIVVRASRLAPAAATTLLFAAVVVVAS
jgi:predicted metal-binding membrane protein